MFGKKTNSLSSSSEKNDIGLLIKKILLALVIIAAIAGISASVYYYKKYQTLKANPNLEAQKETENIIAAVGKLIELPTDETPTLATIADYEKLKDQAFFKTAANGDIVLAYMKAMKAILYRPSANKIINVAPMVIDQGSNNQTAVASAGLKIAYYNGTETVGLSGLAEKAVKVAYPDYQTGILTGATKKDYTKTLVVDLKGLYGKEAGDLADLLGGMVGSLPAGEAKPDADILIISGK